MHKPTKNQKKLLYQYKQSLSLSKHLFQIGVGTLLGDASIQTQDGGKTYRLKYQQSNRLHRDYLFYLHTQWNDWVLSPPHFHEGRNMWSFQTLSHADFQQLAHIFVVDSQGNRCKKHIKPLLVEQYLSPCALAHWIMDDGGKSCYNRDVQRKGYSLNTHSFTKQEVEWLARGLQARYGLHCWLKCNKNKWIIVISGHDHDKMMDLIGPYIVPSMYHKMPWNVPFELMT